MYNFNKEEMAIKKPKYDYLLKLIIIGDSSVGKTCLLLRFSDDQFPTSHMPTIGIDFRIKTINIMNKNVKLQVWDTAGQERFRTITQTYYKGAMGILLVYDCTEEVTFNNIQNWLKQIEAHAQPNVQKVLIANKSDMPDDQKKVDPERGRALAEQHGLCFFETSAKSGHNVAQVFTEIATLIIGDLQSQGIHTNNTRAMGGAAMNNKNAMGQGGDYGEDTGTIKIGQQYHQEDKPNQNEGGGCC